MNDTCKWFATVYRPCAVTRKDLRPNDWQEIWPELAAGPQPTTEAANA